MVSLTLLFAKAFCRYFSHIPCIRSWYSDTRIPEWLQIVRRALIVTLPSLLCVYFASLVFPQWIEQPSSPDDLADMIESLYTLKSFILTGEVGT